MTFDDKRVIFITTKNIDYLRNTQEIALIKKSCKSCRVIGFPDKSYPKRLFKVYAALIKTRKKDFDCAFVGFAPQLVVPFFKGKFKGKPLYIDFFISMFDTLCLDRKKFAPDSVFAKILRRFDMTTLKRADFIISDTKAHAAFFAGELGADMAKIETLYLEADKSIYYPRRQDGHKDFTVLYFGSVLPLQGVDVILKAIGSLCGEDGLRFVFVGPVGEKTVKPESDKIEYIPWLSQNELAEKIAESDLCLAGHFNSEIGKAKRTIPGKAYIYRAMDKPMILGENEANRELFSESDGETYFVEMGNATALAELILRIKREKAAD